MSQLSKMQSPESYKDYFIRFFVQNKKNQVLGVSMLGVILYLIRIKKSMSKINNSLSSVKTQEEREKKSKGQIDSVFINRIRQLIKIVVPSIYSLEFLDMTQMMIFLILRTFLSIYIANINGRIVKSLIEVKFLPFIDKIVNLALIAIPASFINSYLEYLNKRLALRFRNRVTKYLLNRYLSKMVFYQLINIDHRIQNPDQILTDDIEKWSTSLSNLFNNVTKPFLDIILFGSKLASLVGHQGPLFILAYYMLSACIIKAISPSFGKLTAIEQKFEGDYRAVHSSLMNHSEEIAFYRGDQWEKQRILNSFDTLITHSRNINLQKLYMGSFDALLVKYGASMIGYTIVGMPVFGPNSKEYLRKVKNDPGVITKDYMQNSSLLINLAKAVGRIVVSYKELQNLAGYTSIIYKLKDVLDDLSHQSFQHQHQQKIIQTEMQIIKFENVQIETPSKEILLEQLNFEIKKGEHLIITGPNGCGKSSLFRYLSELWLINKGRIIRPNEEQLFYVPQKPYLPKGTLREQVIYPHTHQQMIQAGVTDQDLEQILKLREGGFNSTNEWNDVLSGGEKQRIAFSRLFYHKPTFAILDECTSAVSMDVESKLFQNCKDHGISLFSVSLRNSLLKYHDYCINLDGLGGYQFRKIDEQDFKIETNQNLNHDYNTDDDNEDVENQNIKDQL